MTFDFTPIHHDSVSLVKTVSLKPVRVKGSVGLIMKFWVREVRNSRVVAIDLPGRRSLFGTLALLATLAVTITARGSLSVAT